MKYIPLYDVFTYLLTSSVTVTFVELITKLHEHIIFNGWCDIWNGSQWNGYWIHRQAAATSEIRWAVWQDVPAVAR